MTNVRLALAQYGQVNTDARAEFASPHQLTLMLFDGAIKSLTLVPLMIEKKDFAGKSRELSRAVNILSGLHESLDAQQGGELAEELGDLYEYMMRCLMQAGRDNNRNQITHVVQLLNEIRDGWRQIPAQFHHQGAQQARALG